MACQPKNDDSNFASNTHELSNEYSREKFSTYLSSFFVFFCKGKNVKLFWKCYLYHVDPKKLKCFAAKAVLNKNWSIDRVDNVKPLLHFETFSWNLCATALHRVTWSVSWNFFNFVARQVSPKVEPLSTIATIARVTKTRISTCNTTLWNLFAVPLHTSFS